MKNVTQIFSFIFFLAASSAVSAQNYYFCDDGNDDNDGLSESSPFKTFDKARQMFEALDGGDSVLLCRGGVFPASGGNGPNSIENFKCSAEEGKQCTMSDYGDSGLRRPLIQVSGGHGLNFEDGGAPNADGGYVISNLMFLLVEANGVDAGIRFYNDVNDVVLDNLHIEGFTLGIQTAGANQYPEPGADEEQNRITLKNSVIINNKSQGWLGGCDDCIIENNHFENNGFASAILDHNIYLASSGGKTVDNMIVRGNTLYKSTHVDGKCQGVSLVAHGEFDGLIIENNLIKEDVGAVSQTCWGISVDPGYAKEETFRNIVIRNNQLLNVGNVGIGCASCDGAVIEDNVMIDQASVLTHGVKVPVRTEDALKSKNVTIKNNNIVLSHDGAVGVTVDGLNPFVVMQNTISQPSTTDTSTCIAKSDANANTDTSSNICNRHTEIVMDGNNVNLEVDAETQAEAQAAAEAQAIAEAQAAAEAQAIAEAQAAVEAQAIAEAQAAAEAQAIAEAEALAAEQAQASVDPDLIAEATAAEKAAAKAATKALRKAEKAAKALANAEAKALIAAEAQSTADDLAEAAELARRIANGESIAADVAQQQVEQFASADNTMNQASSSSSSSTAAGGSSSSSTSGGGSSSSSSSSSMSSSDGTSPVSQGDYASVATYTGQSSANSVTGFDATVPNTGSSSINDTVVTQLDMGDGSIPVIQGTVTQSGVLEALQADYSQVDPSQCRASAGGKCILF